MRVAVTGKSGQLARCLADCVPADVVATFLGRDSMDMSVADFDLSPLKDFKPDLVINASAYTAVDKAEEEQEAAYQLNALAPIRLASFCKGQGISLVHVSTDYVFDGAGQRPHVESDPVAPLNVYAMSKLQGEQGVAAALPEHIILRASWVYSAYGNNFVKTMLRLAEVRDRLTIVHDQRGAPTSAHDMADAIWRIVKVVQGGRSDPYGLYHYSGNGNASWAEFAEDIFENADGLIEKKPEVVRIPTSEFPTPAKRPGYTVLDCSKFDQTFEIERPEWQSSLRVVLSKLKEDIS